LTSMVSEYAPDRHRNFCILLLQAAYPIGAIGTGFFALWLLPLYGWRPLFIVAGIFSLLAIPIVLCLLPESLHYLANRQPPSALPKVNATLKKMGHAPLSVFAPVSTEQPKSIFVGTLFLSQLKQQTIYLWLAFFMSFATLYFLLSWVVQLAVQLGLSVQNAIYAGTSLNLGAFIGGVSLGFIAKKIGLKRVIALFFVLGAIMIIMYGSISSSVSVVLLMIFVLMFFVQGAFIGLYAVAARLYPTDIRTTGVGWAIGAGRIGAILGPAIAGFIVGSNVSISWTFAIFSVPIIIAAIAVMKISNREIN
jgi:MFS transporter, AAHS family, 4-hydroxybenzoate transporter